jgi:hypothetical protein
MPFKPGRLGEIWLNGVDVSNYFSAADLETQVEMLPVTTFKTGGTTNTYKQYIAGLAASTLTAQGYYDTADADKVRDTLQAAVGQATFLPAGGVAIGDQARLLNINSSDFKNGAKVGEAILMEWTAKSTSPVGIGTVLHVLKSENVGTVTGPGDGVETSLANTTGGIGHFHVTAMTPGDTHTFQLQDSTTINGVYANIAGAALVTITAVGSQRLIVTGTVRQFVQVVATIGGHAATYAVAFART